MFYPITSPFPAHLISPNKSCRGEVSPDSQRIQLGKVPMKQGNPLIIEVAELITSVYSVENTDSGVFRRYHLDTDVTPFQYDLVYLFLQIFNNLSQI